MSENMPDLNLTATGEELLADVRVSQQPNALFGRTPAECETEVKRLVEPLLAGLPLPAVVRYQYWWYLRELTRLLRTKTGPELAFHLELALRKWQGFGLEPGPMQFLLNEVWTQVRRGAGGAASD